MKEISYSQVKDLLQSAIQLPLEERPGFLQQACGNDIDLRQAVDSLLNLTTLATTGFPSDFLWAQEVPLPSGTEVGSRYVIEDVHGKGGMAVVYLAKDRRVADRQVVVKVMRAFGPARKWLLEKLRLEIEALSTIKHHGVVGIFDAGELPDGRPYLVLDFVAGPNLAQVIASGPISPLRAARIIQQVGRALHATHQANVLHLDLKPENIMLRPGTDGEQAIVIDFGIAALKTEAGAEPQFIRPAGSRNYMAPEQFAGWALPQSDIYALGCVIYAMLTGKTLQPSLLRPTLKGLPDRLQFVSPMLEKALAFDPHQRQTDILQFTETIAEALEKGRGPRKTAKLIVIATATLVLVTACGVMWTRKVAVANLFHTLALFTSRQPQAQLSWTVGDPQDVRVVTLYIQDTDRPVRAPILYILLRVENKGSVSARGVKAWTHFLQRFDPSTGAFTERPYTELFLIASARGGDAWDEIPSGQFRLFDFGWLLEPRFRKYMREEIPLSFDTDPGQSIFRLAVNRRPVDLYHLLRPGRYRLGVDVSSENSATVSKTVEFEIQPQWNSADPKTSVTTEIIPPQK